MFLSNNTQIIYPGNGAECKECAAPLFGMKRKYCSSKCTDKYRNGLKPKYENLPKVHGPRACVFCSVEFYKKDSGLLNYCSDKCQKLQQYEANKDPMSTYGSGKRKRAVSGHYQSWCQCAYDETVIDNDVLAQIEYLCTDEPYVQEDLEWLERVLREEQTAAFYEDGTHYKADPISWKLRKDPNAWWWKKSNMDLHRRRGWWTRQHFSTLNDLAIKKRYRKMKYGERKKFMASIKNKPVRNTPTKN